MGNISKLVLAVTLIVILSVPANAFAVYQPPITIQNPTPAAGDQFGWSVSISGDKVLVGAIYDDTGANDAGAAYLFDGTTGNLLQTFVSPTPAANDWFGFSVSISGDKVLVGTPFDDTGANDAGAAYLFDGITGNLLQTFVSPTPAANDKFGISVSISGDKVLVGAYQDDTGAINAGSAYLFDGITGALLQTFQKPTPAAGDQFGSSVSISGDKVLVGAYWDDPGANDAGAAYLFLEFVNNPPISQNDEYLVTQDTQLILNSQSGVLSNDGDPDGDTLVATIETTTSNGIISLNPDGSFAYQPNSGFLGTDSFTYVADDGNGGTATATVEFTIRSPTSVGTMITCDDTGPPDNDFDNICDGWESDGLKIDELDGSSLLIPFEFGPSFDITCVSNFGCLPDPGNKDIYVEVDWMSEQAPDQSAIQDVVDAFANKGIRLHVLLDEDIGVQIEQTSVDFTDTDFTDPTGFVALKQNYFGTAQERLDALDEPKILEAKRQIFHYALFIHEQKERPGTSGWGEIKGNDFAVSLGSFGGGTGTPSEQSGTFMHELGHNLGLHHGGPENAGAEDDNCKPNYLSVMSYSFQFPSYLSDRPLDYSRSVLAPLDETSLDEAAGIQASTPPNLKTIYGPPAYRESVTGVGIDWDESGGISGTANTNINNLGILGCQSDTWSVLTGHDDWNNLVFDFRVQTHFDSGLTFYRTADQEMTVQAVDQIQESVITHQIEFFDSISDSALTGDPVLTRQAFEDAISEIQLLVQSDDFDNAILKIDQLIALVPTMISDQNELDNILDSLHNWRGTLASSNEEPIQLVTKTSQEQTQTLIEELENPLVTPQSKQTSDDISKAIDDLTNSLDDKFWTDPNTLDSQHGDEAIHLQEKAAKSLMKITNNPESDSMISYIQEIIEQITQIDRKLAQSAIIDAYANAVNDDNISSAQDEMAQGDKAVSEGKYDDAIHHYEKAWKDVR